MSRPRWPFVTVALGVGAAALGVGAVALASAEPGVAQQAPPPNEPGVTEEQFRAVLTFLRLFLGGCAFLIGAVMVLEILIVQSKGRIVEWTGGRAADRRYPPRALAFRGGTALFLCGWGAALSGGGSPIGWMARATIAAAIAGVLLLGVRYRSLFGWGQ